VSSLAMRSTQVGPAAVHHTASHFERDAGALQNVAQVTSPRSELAISASGWVSAPT
jgi:hypothetical protein